jgi:hypothetical protein
MNHFVYSSGDRGGLEKSTLEATGVKNFAAKWHVEKHVEKHVETRAAMSAILRPVTFMENITNDTHGIGFTRMWEQVGVKRLQLVATKDIGWFGAQSFLHPDTYRNAALSLVGGELTQPEADAIFKEVVSRPMPIALCVVGSVLKLVLRDTLGDMFAWFKENGYGAMWPVARVLNRRCRNFGPGSRRTRGCGCENGKGNFGLNAHLHFITHLYLGIMFLYGILPHLIRE